jgi:hypothetical protein
LCGGKPRFARRRSVTAAVVPAGEGWSSAAALVVGENQKYERGGREDKGRGGLP